MVAVKFLILGITVAISHDLCNDTGIQPSPVLASPDNPQHERNEPDESVDW